MRNLVTSKYSNKSLKFKYCAFHCPTCSITREFDHEYYQNAAILTDNDQKIHIPEVI